MIIRKTEEDDRRLVHSPEGGKQQKMMATVAGMVQVGRSAARRAYWNCPDQLIEQPSGGRTPELTTEQHE